MIRLALFDIDGTLISTNGAGVKAFGRAFDLAFGITDATEGMSFAGRTDTSLLREMLVRHNLEASQANFDKFFGNYVFLLDQHLRDSGGRILPGVQTLIRAMAAQPVPPSLGLLTGNIRLGAEIKLRRFKLWETFTTGGFADDAEDRDHIARVARQRGSQIHGRELAGEEILVVGDTPLDVRCGRAIGARVLAVATGGAPRNQLESSRPDWVVDDLTQVSAEQVCA